jgi:hypothetical protein
VPPGLPASETPVTFVYQHKQAEDNGTLPSAPTSSFQTFGAEAPRCSFAGSSDGVPLFPAPWAEGFRLLFLIQADGYFISLQEAYKQVLFLKKQLKMKKELRRE